MTTWNRVNGDVNDTIVAQLAGVANLTGVTAVEAHVWPVTGGAAVTLTAAVTDATNRYVTVQLGAGGGWLPSAAAGPWNIEYQTTWSGGAIITWPEKGSPPDQIIVRQQGA